MGRSAPRACRLLMLNFLQPARSSNREALYSPLIYPTCPAEAGPPLVGMRRWKLVEGPITLCSMRSLSAIPSAILSSEAGPSQTGRRRWKPLATVEASGDGGSYQTTVVVCGLKYSFTAHCLPFTVDCIYFFAQKNVHPCPTICASSIFISPSLHLI